MAFQKEFSVWNNGNSIYEYCRKSMRFVELVKSPIPYKYIQIQVT